MRGKIERDGEPYSCNMPIANAKSRIGFDAENVGARSTLVPVAMVEGSEDWHLSADIDHSTWMSVI